MSGDDLLAAIWAGAARACGRLGEERSATRQERIGAQLTDLSNEFQAEAAAFGHVSAAAPAASPLTEVTAGAAMIEAAE